MHRYELRGTLSRDVKDTVVILAQNPGDIMFRIYDDRDTARISSGRAFSIRADYYTVCDLPPTEMAHDKGTRLNVEVILEDSSIKIFRLDPASFKFSTDTSGIHYIDVGELKLE